MRAVEATRGEIVVGETIVSYVQRLCRPTPVRRARGSAPLPASGGRWAVRCARSPRGRTPSRTCRNPHTADQRLRSSWPRNATSSIPERVINRILYRHAQPSHFVGVPSRNPSRLTPRDLYTEFDPPQKFVSVARGWARAVLQRLPIVGFGSVLVYRCGKCNREGAVVAVRGKAPVDDSVDVIADALVTASRLLVAISARSIAEVDESITTPQFRALVILSSRGATNLATLAGLLDVQPSTIGRMVERLVSAGFIDRRQHPSSRRELMVELTPRGHDVVNTVTARRREEIARVVHAMPERERRGLVTALTAFTAAGGEPPAHSSM